MYAKGDYISAQLRDSSLALKWYERLKKDILYELSFFPYKYPVIKKGISLEKDIHILTIRNDIVLFSIDENRALVYVLNVYTKGKNLSDI